MAHIQLHRLSGSSRAHGAVERVSLSAGDGECLVLFGAPDSGTRTLLRMVAGLERVRSGQILLDGRKTGGRGLGTGDIALLSGAGRTGTVWPGRNWTRRAPVTPDALLHEMAERLEVGAAVNRRAAALTQEEHCRLSLARALAGGARVLLLDAPFAGLDSSAAHRMRILTRSLMRDFSLTAILATGDPVEALAMADRLAVLERGVLVQEGTARQVHDHPASIHVAGQLGDPPMSLLPGHVRGGVFTGRNVQVEGLAVSDGPVTLGFRAAEAEILTGEMGFTGCEIAAPVCGVEFRGDRTLVTVRAGAGLASVVADRDISFDQGETIRILLPPDSCHLFDPHSGARIA